MHVPPFTQVNEQTACVVVGIFVEELVDEELVEVEALEVVVDEEDLVEVVVVVVPVFNKNILFR
jgi:hypothetical protein